MSKVVNLRQARRERAREEARRTADANSVRHGRTKAERAEAAARLAAETRHLDGHRRDTDPPE